jgi:hypothetical protein
LVGGIAGAIILQDPEDSGHTTESSIHGIMINEFREGGKDKRI